MIGRNEIILLCGLLWLLPPFALMKLGIKFDNALFGVGVLWAILFPFICMAIFWRYL